MVVRGRDLLFDALKQLEIRYIFGNPGTTELPVIDGCAAHPEVTYISSLHEDVAVGMAMGYARATGKVGVANLHVAPGLAHGLGNLYNAHRAGIPLLVTAGQQDTRMQIEEPILTGNLVEMARAFTKWSHEVRHVAELPTVLQRAFKVAMAPPMGPVFLSLPADVMLAETDAVMPSITRVGNRIRGDEDELARAAALLAGAKNPVIISGDGAGLSDAWPELVQVAERLGIPVYTEPLSTCANFPTEHPLWAGGVPSSPSGMRAVFAGVDVALLCGFTSQNPTAFYDGNGPLIPPSTQLIYLHENAWEIGKNYFGAAAVLGHVKESLRGLIDALGGVDLDEGALAERSRLVRTGLQQRRAKLVQGVEAAQSQVPIAVDWVAAELNAVLPQVRTLVNESVSNTASFVNYVTMHEPLGFWGGKGGGLGHSGAAALGIKIAAPERTVVNVVGDGTFLYYPQVLWSAVNSKIPVLFVVLNNTSYRILKQGLKGMGGPWGPVGTYPPGLDITGPEVDFAALAGSFGVKAERVTDPEALRGALQRGLAAEGPYLIDVAIDKQI